MPMTTAQKIGCQKPDKSAKKATLAAMSRPMKKGWRVAVLGILA